jgi:hypothetical protein
MNQLVPHLRLHFDVLEDRLLCFAMQGIQTEGWFKGEMLVLLERLAQQQVIHSFDREVSHLRGRIDFRVDSTQRNWVELKHWLIGKQKGTSYAPSFYFRDPTSVGIVADVRKLATCPHGDPRWLLILMSANPGVDGWKRGIEGFNEKFHPFRIQSYTDPSQFPPSYFLGLLDVQCDRITQQAALLNREAVR